MKKCSIDECGDKYHARDLCRRHYLRNWYFTRSDARDKRKIERHGLIDTPEYSRWTQMKKRCNNDSDKSYKHYGGRGIRVCERWMNSFVSFYGDMGCMPDNSYSIERIDNDGDYKPLNCKWATSKEQANNRRSSHHLTVKGKVLTVQQWCEEYGIPDTTLHNRLRRGWSPERAVTTPRMTQFNGNRYKT